jgi:hypothetical protein
VLLTVPRATATADGADQRQPAPDTLQLRVGERYRLRIVDVHTYRPSMIVRWSRDSTPVSWRAVAKDGMDLPADRATTRTRRAADGNGETYDFELTPTEAANLRLTVIVGGGCWRAAGHRRAVGGVEAATVEGSKLRRSPTTAALISFPGTRSIERAERAPLRDLLRRAEERGIGDARERAADADAADTERGELLDGGEVGADDDVHRLRCDGA